MLYVDYLLHIYASSATKTMASINNVHRLNCQTYTFLSNVPTFKVLWQEVKKKQNPVVTILANRVNVTNGKIVKYEQLNSPLDSNILHRSHLK